MGMSKAEEDEQVRLERARAAGLFRYMLIREAADPALSTRQRGAMVREIAAREHAGPSGQPVRVTRWTLDVWIRAWRQGGFDALVPSPRQSQPRTPPEVMALAAALKKENPARTAAQVQRILKAQSGWAPDERTIQRMFHRTGLTAMVTPQAAPVFGRFEAARPNEIWTGDVLCLRRHKTSYADPVFMPTTAAEPSLSDLHETSGTYEISVAKQGEMGPLRQ